MVFCSSRRRISSVVDADKIIVIRDGKVIEQGSHNSLLRSNGHYSWLWANQTTTKPIAPSITDTLGQVQQKTSKEVADRLSVSKDARGLQRRRQHGSVMSSDEGIGLADASGSGTIEQDNDFHSRESPLRPDVPEFVPSPQRSTPYNTPSPFRRNYRDEQNLAYSFRNRGQEEWPALGVTENNSNGLPSALSGRSTNVGSAVQTLDESFSPKYMTPREPSKWRVRREFTNSEPADIGTSPD